MRKKRKTMCLSPVTQFFLHNSKANQCWSSDHFLKFFFPSRLVFIHLFNHDDDKDFDDGSLNSTINCAFSYFSYNHLQLLDVVEGIENEMTSGYPKRKKNKNDLINFRSIIF